MAKGRSYGDSRVSSCEFPMSKLPLFACDDLVQSSSSRDRVSRFLSASTDGSLEQVISISKTKHTSEPLISCPSLK